VRPSDTIVWRAEHGVAPKPQAVLVFSTASTALTKLRTVSGRHGLSHSEPGINSVLVSAESSLLTQVMQQWRDVMSVAEVAETRAALFESRTPSPEDLARAPLLLTDLSQVLALMGTRWLVQLLAADSYFVVFQPLVSISTGQIVAYECLLRGILLDGAEVGAAQLFSTAQSLGIARDLEHLSWQKAIKQGRELARSGCLLFMNFSPSAARDPKFSADQTQLICAESGVDLRQIVLEVTEAEKDYELDDLQIMMQEYRAAGAKFALDDLGSGHSSVLHLARLRPDYVKLDQGLVRGAHSDQARSVFLKAISDAAHELRIPVVAEGVETAEDLKHSIAIGADLVQGYYLARPARIPPPVSEEAMRELEQCACIASKPRPA
jgi:EAL domain-containing protein (putative c-di-GMP-specific phosphodiesterase class I)